MSITLTSEEASKRAETYLGKGAAMVPATIQEDHLFFAVEVRYSEFVVGGLAAVVVDKRDARVFEYCEPYPSACEALEMQRYRNMEEDSLREAFPHYDMQNSYKVTITQVRKPERLTDLLLSFGLTYIVPEKEAGDIWRIPKEYDRDFLHQRLIGEPPIQFSNPGGGIAMRQLDSRLEPVLLRDLEKAPEHKSKKQPVDAKQIKAWIRRMEYSRAHGGWRSGSLFDLFCEARRGDLCDFQLEEYAPQKRIGGLGNPPTEDFEPIW